MRVKASHRNTSIPSCSFWWENRHYNKRGHDSNEKGQDKDITHTEENWKKGNKPTQNPKEKNWCEGPTIEIKSNWKPAGRNRMQYRNVKNSKIIQQ
jgi:hypothetical protein